MAEAAGWVSPPARLVPLGKMNLSGEPVRGIHEGRTQVTADTVQVDDMQLIALPSAVNCADLFVRFTLAEWRLRPLTEETGLVARALTEAAVAVNDPNSPSMITLRLRLRGDCLVVEIEDSNLVGLPAAHELEGRRSGVDRPPGRGTLAWCEVALPPGMTAAAVPLPRRERRKSAAAALVNDEGPEVAPEVIERILLGLNKAQQEMRPE